MKKRTILQRIILVIMALIAIAASAFYLILEAEKPWTAFYIACCGGILVINLTVMLILVRRNIK
jgi:hypothetical protein